MSNALTEALVVFIILQLLFGYLEYQYKADIFYIAGRLLTAPKYIIPSVTLPIAYVIISRLLNFLFF